MYFYFTQEIRIEHVAANGIGQTDARVDLFFLKFLKNWQQSLNTNVDDS